MAQDASYLTFLARIPETRHVLKSREERALVERAAESPVPDRPVWAWRDDLWEMAIVHGDAECECAVVEYIAQGVPSARRGAFDVAKCYGCGSFWTRSAQVKGR